ncbi:MAG: hypothetical protein HC853_18710 [Anaerolineae bacterium]|nr:hypothetical protein [Anaerolineae bacterium]
MTKASSSRSGSLTKLPGSPCCNKRNACRLTQAMRSAAPGTNEAMTSGLAVSERGDQFPSTPSKSCPRSTQAASHATPAATSAGNAVNRSSLGRRRETP